MTKQEFARKRNFVKMRLLGFVIDTRFLTETEKTVYMEIRHKIHFIIENFTENSVNLGLNAKQRCHYCSKVAIDKGMCKTHKELYDK